jgi:hypothetical protein
VPLRRIYALLLILGCWAAMLVTVPAEAATAQSTPLVGARVNDITFKQATTELGSLKVTRLFYQKLPSTFNRQGIPNGVLLIVSYKQPNTNVASYVRSIPTGQQVQLVFHHEPEADYADGSTFVSEFNAQQKLAEAANQSIRFAFVAGAFAYRSGHQGYSGSFIPPHADRYYLDSYQRGVAYSPIRPAAQDPAVQRYMALLAQKGKLFNGFTEYGRGCKDATQPLTDAMVQQRLKVFAADNTYLRSLRGIRVWSYWYTTDVKSDRQWRLTDSRSQQGWRAITSQ